MIIDKYGYQFKYEIEVDPFTKDKSLIWKTIATKTGCRDCECFVFPAKYPDNRTLLFSLCGEQNNKSSIGFAYFFCNHVQSSKGDKVLFLFDDNSVHEISISDTDGDHTGYSVLFQEDIDALSSKKLTHIRYLGKNDTVTYSLEDNYDGKADILFNEFIRLYAQVMKDEFDWIPLSKEIQGIIDSSSKVASNNTTQECFVYLMFDSNTGYYKIGMSNTPEYREKTLQSEKPTIEMICNKRYPSRQIASAIESALHNVFAEKRVRGEWFDLDKVDVSQIILSLS